MRAPATGTTSGSCARRLSWRRLEATSRRRARSSPPRLRGTREIRTWRCRARGCSAGSWAIQTARARYSPPPPPPTPRITACCRRGRLWNRDARGIEAARTSWPAWRRLDRSSNAPRTWRRGPPKSGPRGRRPSSTPPATWTGPGSSTPAVWPPIPPASCACEGSGGWSERRSGSRRRGTTSSERWTWTPATTCASASSR
mmetsp:Transcript_2949/g.11599  ORF Transcript_2949/g.11599 Transcript_2949/m.11599 type:complete len:200 (+) Transcript_2949:3224-3823(+)